jgi:hypothetical protein
MRPAIAAVVLLFAAVQAAPPPELGREIARVRSEIAASVPVDQQAPLNMRLDRAAASLAAGRTYLALYLMESASEGASAFAFAKSAGLSTRDAFLKKWSETGAPRPAAAATSGSPAIVDAIAAAADARAPATYQASRPYAEDAGVEAGAYYLGESRALVAFAAFARATRFAGAGRRPPFRSIDREIAAFDAEMTTTYESMARADHPAYIAASAALKQARSLNDAHEYAGALFEYLLSRLLFAPLRGPAAQDATPARIAEARASLGAGVDHSIAELFLQLADEGVSGSVPAQRRGAAAVIDDVLPTYVAAVAPPPVVTTTAAQAQVTVTLVRWPFT